MEPKVLFGIQFTMSLVAFALIARWHVWPHLSSMPPELALVPLLWVHAFRIVGGTILAPESVGPGVPMEFREMIGYGDLVTALLAMVALIALRARLPRAIALVWLFLAVATIDTVNAIVHDRAGTGVRCQLSAGRGGPGSSAGPPNTAIPRPSAAPSRSVRSRADRPRDRCT